MSLLFYWVAEKVLISPHIYTYTWDAHRSTHTHSDSKNCRMGVLEGSPEVL